MPTEIDRTPPGDTPARPDPVRGPGQPRRVASEALFGGGSVVLIDHEGETYSLRRTRLGKLILTK